MKFCLLGALFVIVVSGSVRSSAGLVLSWPNGDPNPDLNHMQISPDGKHIYVAGKNMIYHLNSSSLELVNSASIGLSNVSVQFMMYMTRDGHGYITTCTNDFTNEACNVRNASDISTVTGRFEQVIRTEKAAAFLVTFGQHNAQTSVETLFTACPHNVIGCPKEQKPGIRWMTYGNANSKKSVNFKSSTNDPKTPVLTERYVSAFAVDTFRLFFSVQKQENNPNVMSSRVAQICQSEGTTDLTYVDMTIKCGRYNIIKDAKKITFGNDTLVVASFYSNDRGHSGKSAICVYTFSDIQSRLLENIRECYKKNKSHQTPQDYIKGDLRCQGTDAEVDYADDVLLCNKERLESYKSVIGIFDLISKPVLEYSDKRISSITMTTKRSEVIGFFGTDKGYILKGVIFSRARKLLPDILIGRGHSVNKDMFMSMDQSHVYAMTKYKMVKLPVEECYKHDTCGVCLGSQDPYCGWCMLENRCSTSESCTSQWISVTENSTCPSIEMISPDIMSVQEHFQLNIQLSRMPENVSIYCRFHNNEANTNFSSDAVASESLTSLRSVVCTSPNENIIPFENNIKGSMIVRVFIMTNLSDSPITEGSITLYNCKTFSSCHACIHKNWTCDWCVYQNECVDSGTVCMGVSNISCKSLRGQQGNGNCPTVTEFLLNDENGTSFDGTSYLSMDEEYTVAVKGSHLPRPLNLQQRYTCQYTMTPTDSINFTATHISDGYVNCTLTKTTELNGTNGTLDTHLSLIWEGSKVDGETLPVTFYKCETLVQPSHNCGKCKSFAQFQPYFKCQWCGSDCKYARSGDCREPDVICPNPEINMVYPLSAHINATTLVDIYGVNLGSNAGEVLDSVTIADTNCAVRDDLYIPSEKITCELEPSHQERKGYVVVALSGRENVTFNKTFVYRVPTITSMFPTLGPLSGGTLVNISGEHLDTGRNISVYFGDDPKRNMCIEEKERTNVSIFCKTTNASEEMASLKVHIQFDGANVTNDNVSYEYKADPVIKYIQPRESFNGGGRILTVMGDTLFAIQEPKIFAIFSDNSRSESVQCKRHDELGVIYCPSPKNPNASRIKRRIKRQIDTQEASLGFEMDDVASVINLRDDISRLIYYPDPTFKFSKPEKYHEFLIIKGKGLGYAATKDDYHVWIGDRCCSSLNTCNITTLENETIYCNPPKNPPPSEIVGHVDKEKLRVLDRFHIRVKVGNLVYTVGSLEYETADSLQDTDDRNKEYVIAAAVVGFLLLLLVIVIIALVVMVKKRKKSRLEKESLEYKMDKMEANIINQCRDEFAALQTAVSDLTSDLEGGNVLFRDYDVYACKTLFASNDTDPVLSTPRSMSQNASQAMETFRGLLRNQQFLLLFIRTMENEKSFSMRDRSNVATMLMVLNDDNMEYITGILKILLNDLVDKNIAAQTPKLLLRRSESVSEKLLTQWLALCLYHFLKERSGSALFILYKAIKIQVEKGPVDYITGCGKYTLSEDKLFTSADREINPQTLVLEVTHFDYIENVEKHISVAVLDCDTVTQAKSKMLEILYKNVAYSQRPTVHSTSLAIQEDDGTQRKLHDEDPSSEKDGIWKQINTLQHYKIQNGMKVMFSFNREIGDTLSTASPDTYILSNSYKRTKQVVRTVSGSNFWHLTKHHRVDGEDDVKLARDLFLPRLLNTKGTLQTYIDDLFTDILQVGDDPPLIIKYLYDFLDAAATRCGITDPDVLHTWKCNSLLLRFWVNIIKNPEFVFDIYKPHIVDSCLSVIAQTLMDSCSTADLKLGPNSPSNKLLFAKDIPRYKNMVKAYFQGIQDKPAVSDQDLNSYLTEKVSQKFSGKFSQPNALLEMYKYVAQYRNAIMREMDNAEASSPGSFSPLTSKLEFVFMSMDMPGE